jgi:hypothetical protein
VAKGLVRRLQTPGQLGLHGTEFHGVGARLKDGHDARLSPQASTQAIQGRADGGGVVGEIIVDGYRSTLRRRGHNNAGAHFHAALDVLE